MKYLSLMLGISCAAIVQTVTANSNELTIIDQIAAEAHYAEEKVVWPGFHPNLSPIVIHISDQHHAYALNFQPGTLPWQKLSSTHFPTYYLADTRGIDLPNGKFAAVDGQLSYIYETASDYSDSYSLSNRAWYYIKNESQINPKNYRYLNLSDDSFNDLSIDTLILLERTILSLSLDESHDTLKQNLLRDAIAVRQYRNSLSSKNTRDLDNAWDVFYGTHSFINFTSTEWNDADYAKAVKNATKYGLCHDLIPNEFNPYYCRDELSKLSSAVYGHALDKKLNGLTWKPKVEKEFKSIAQMAIENEHLTDAEAKEMTQAAIRNPEYHYLDISAFVHHEMDEYLANMDVVKNEFQNIPGIKVYIIGEGWGAAFMMSSREGYRITRNKLLFKNIQMPFDDDTITILPYAAIDYVRKGFNEIDQEKSYTILNINENAVLLIDGKKISAKEFIRDKKVMQYQKLDVIDDQIQHLDHLIARGTIDAHDGKLTIIEERQDKNLRKRLVNSPLNKHHKMPFKNTTQE